MEGQRKRKGGRGREGETEMCGGEEKRGSIGPTDGQTDEKIGERREGG